MNVISKIIEDIHFQIPLTILEIAFTNTNQSWRRAPLSVEEMIKQNVINSKVLPDLNIVGGDTAYIHLSGIPVDIQDPYTYVYDIPLVVTSGRQINSVLAVKYAGGSGLNGKGGMIDGCPNSETSQATAAMSNQFANMPSVSTAMVELIGPNIVLVRDSAGLKGNPVLHCKLTYDQALNSINPKSIKVISKLAVFATKAYIYNKLNLNLGDTYLKGGQSLDQIKNVIETFSDAAENYNNYLEEVVERVLFMNDDIAHGRFIKRQINIALS